MALLAHIIKVRNWKGQLNIPDPAFGFREDGFWRSRKIMLFRFHSLGGSLFRYEARFFPNHTPAEGSTVAMAFGKGSKKAAITQNPKLHRGRTTL
ncbi:uncharacterized protein [Arachis hypogaea]|uniref:uncharacterized protein isoform X5 n=1 Tax=Arachis hypogaea TaxID=3818 RepID=UPI000DEC7663